MKNFATYKYTMDDGVSVYESEGGALWVCLGPITKPWGLEWLSLEAYLMKGIYESN